MNHAAYKFIRTASVDQMLEVAYKMIAEHPDTFLRVAGIRQMFEIEEKYSKQIATFSQNDVNNLRAMGNNKIMRIKKIREITNFGLLEAKNLEESLEFAKLMADSHIGD